MSIFPSFKSIVKNNVFVYSHNICGRSYSCRNVLLRRKKNRFAQNVNRLISYCGIFYVYAYYLSTCILPCLKPKTNNCNFILEIRTSRKLQYYMTFYNNMFILKVLGFNKKFVYRLIKHFSIN